MDWVLGIVVFGLLGGVIGYVALSATGTARDGDRFFLGIPVGITGLVIGEILFAKVFHFSGWKPLFNHLVLGPNGFSGGGFNDGHLAWDILVGLVGCLTAYVPVCAISRLVPLTIWRRRRVR